MRTTVRIPIRVSVFDANTLKTITTSTFTRQTQLSDFVQLKLREYRGKDVAFEARVMYNRKEDFFNEFQFTTFKDFKEKLEPCLEKELLKDMIKDKTMPKEYAPSL